jgi:predicted phosphodiesterase
VKVIILGDVQGNLAALEVVLAHVPSDASQVIGLGDFASGPQPGPVIERLRLVGATCVRGNMDEVIAAPTRSEQAGDDRFAEIDAWCTSRLTTAQRAWLTALPLTAEIELPRGSRLVACHGSPTSVTDVIGPDTPVGEASRHLEGSGADVLAVGHLHDPLLRIVGDAWVLNPGSVGWPNARGDGLRPTQASYAVLEAEEASIGVSFARVTYPPEELQRSVIASGMPHAGWYLGHWRM